MRPLVPIRILVVYAVLVPAADAETLTFQGWVAAHPVLHDVLLIVIAVILVGGATAIGVFKWVRHLALRTLEGREAKGRLNRLIASAMRIDEGDIRRAVTPDWIATMVDSPAARTRIVAALGTDEGRMAVAEALKGSEAKREIAAAMLDEGVRQALIVILTTYVDARAAIANVVHEVDLRISVQETIESGELDEAILDVVFGELGDHRLSEWYSTRGVELMERLAVARGIARALRHGLIEEEEVLNALRGMFEVVTPEKLRDGIRRIQEQG
jgi:hypothetical protein